MGFIFISFARSFVATCHSLVIVRGTEVARVLEFRWLNKKEKKNENRHLDWMIKNMPVPMLISPTVDKKILRASPGWLVGARGP
jgi:hypothetical protein